MKRFARRYFCANQIDFNAFEWLTSA